MCRRSNGGKKRAKLGLTSASWLIRGQHNRLLENEAHLLSEVENTKAWGEIEFDLPKGRGRKSRHVVQSLYSKRVRLKKTEVTVILSREENPPAGEKAIEWFFITNDDIDSFEAAATIIRWYLCRWQIEIFFKILKSGCKIEALQLESKKRLEVALSFL